MPRDPHHDQILDLIAKSVTNHSFGGRPTLAKFLNVTVDSGTVEKNLLIVTLIMSCLFGIEGGSLLESMTVLY